ncbi:MAG: excisionase [Peptoanaerobacter stomatis]|uniref:excisionase n=1 Tax=Peptoanaerobacter stomatis TaxID=796937 RepID=UPI003F9FECEF
MENILTRYNFDDTNFIPIWEKSNLTIEEASKYFCIGINKLRELTDDRDCEYVLFVGKKRLIKRKVFEEFLRNEYSV